jgi:hypothetical protein
MKTPEWFSWRQNTIMIIGAIAGVLIAQKLVLNQYDANLGIGMLIGPLVGTLIGAAIGSYIQYRRTDYAIIDELNQSIINNAMIHGFIAYSALTGYQAFTKTVFSPSESFIIATFFVVASLILQSLKFLASLGDIIS